MSVGNRIRALRRSLGMSQPALAKKANVGQSTISDLENDKKVLLLKICRLLHLH
jgi:transcriptional regulator with XRE-family HTH domain